MANQPTPLRVAPKSWKWGEGLFLLVLWIAIQILQAIAVVFHQITPTSFFIVAVITALMAVGGYNIVQQINKGKKLGPKSSEGILLVIRVAFMIMISGAFWFALEFATLGLRDAGIISTNTLPFLYNPNTDFFVDWLVALAVGVPLGYGLWPNVNDKGYYSRAFSKVD